LNKKMGKIEEKERYFSLELDSKAQLSNVSLSDNSRRCAFIGGTIGLLKSVHFVEGVVMEVTGDKGVLRVDLCEEEVAKRESNDSQEVSA
jgi:hypothetical protein